jgi:hypothetical protein
MDYVKLVQECWSSDPNRRPKVTGIVERLIDIKKVEIKNSTEIPKSPDIGPIATNNPGAIYTSRPLSSMIRSAISIRSLRCQAITSELGKNIIVWNWASRPMN